MALLVAGAFGLAYGSTAALTMTNASDRVQMSPPAPKPPVSAKAGRTTPRNSKLLHGIASWYGGLFDGKQTASGETFDQGALTACHPTLPFGTLVRVINLRNRKSVVVRINDRGYLNPGRVIDLSTAAANQIGLLRAGLAKVRLEIVAEPAHA